MELTDHVKTMGRSQFRTGLACPQNMMRQTKKGLSLEEKGDKAEKMGNGDSADVCWNIVVRLRI